MLNPNKKIDYEIAEFSRESEDKRLINSFADFLALNEISGRHGGVSQSSVVSSENVVDRSTTVEVIKDETIKADMDCTPLTVLIHRDERNDIRSIEVMCTCGKHATIALEYDEDPEEFNDV